MQLTATGYVKIFNTPSFFINYSPARLIDWRRGRIKTSDDFSSCLDTIFAASQELNQSEQFVQSIREFTHLSH